MRALIIYSSAPKVALLAQGVAEGLQKSGARVQLLEAKLGSDSIIAAPYDLVCVGSPVLGTFGGRVADDVDASIKRCSRLEGKQAAAFVTGGLFGAGRSLRQLMSLLERQGAWVQDFAKLSNQADASEFGRRLEKLLLRERTK